MIDKNKFEKIKYEHGEYASWAIWADQGEKPKSNIGDLSVLDPEINTELLTLLKPEIIFVALNFSRGEGIKKPFSNFHDKNPSGTDFKIRYAFKDSPFWGGYMTDIFEKENIKLFLKELNDLEVKNPTIIAFGNDTYDIIKRNIQGINILKIPHYAHQINKEKYRTQIQNILKF